VLRSSYFRYSITPLLHEDFVGIAPHPVFAWLEGTDDGMFIVAVVSGGVFVLGRIAATHMAAGEAEAQMDPGVSHFKTLFATSTARFDFVNLIEVRALLCHENLLLVANRACGLGTQH